MVYTGKIPVYLSITSKRINNEIYKPFKRSGEEHLDIVLTVYNIQHCDTLSSHTLPGSLSAAQTDGPHSSSDTVHKLTLSTETRRCPHCSGTVQTSL